VLLEPIIGNAGSISASQQWLQRLRDLCDEHGTLLLIDEVKSGFRVDKGGAQALYGIHADLTTYAKAMGNGYPVAAFGGRADVMDVVGSQRGAVVHGGTYTANLIGLSAAQATLAILSDTQALHTVHQAGQQVKSLLSRVFTRAGLAHAFAGPPSMLGIHFTPHVPQTYRDWRKTDSQLYNLFAWELISRGVMLEPDSREPWFFCEAHGQIRFIKKLRPVNGQAIGVVTRWSLVVCLRQFGLKFADSDMGNWHALFTHHGSCDRLGSIASLLPRCIGP
jgi:glutamate-1-semialdehyde 2,1-aminomutase